MRIVCQQTILMKYHALIIGYFWKSGKTGNGHLLQIIGGALRVNASGSIYTQIVHFDPLEQLFLMRCTFKL